MSGNESRGISRRRFLKGTAAAGLGTAAAAGGITPAGVPKAAAEPAPDAAPRRASCGAWTWSSRAPRPRVASGSCSRASRRTRRRTTLLEHLGEPMEERPIIDAAITDPLTEQRLNW